MKHLNESTNANEDATPYRFELLDITELLRNKVTDYSEAILMVALFKATLNKQGT